MTVQVVAGDSGVHSKNVDKEQPWPKAGAAYFALAVITFATFLNFFDQTAFGLLIERIKTDFHLSNIQLGWLTGPANIIFYFIVLLPLSRLADIYPRKYVLAGGVFLIAILNATGGLTMTFWALFASRMMVGAGGSAHAPAAYSLLADLFPPEKRALPFSLLQFGFIFGSTWGFLIAGQLLAMVLPWPEMHFGFIAIHGWKYVLLLLAIPGIITALFMMLITEPPRRGVIAEGKPLPFKTVIGELWKRRAVYGPLFFGLGFSAMSALGLPAWLTPLMKRSYGWSEQEIGQYLSPILFVGQIAGLVLGPVVIKWLNKRYNDVNIRATVIFFALSAPFAIIGPMMPNGILALCCFAITGMFGIASAVPQNLAIQEITPNEMRGQATGLYLMMFTAFGMMGPLVIGILIDKVFGHDTDVWKALSLSGAVLMPLAAFIMSRGIKPYANEVERLEKIEKENAHV
jgi:MFS family permease